MLDAVLDPTRDYALFHRDRLNLALHAVLVPAFALGCVAALACAIAGDATGTLVFAVVPVLSIAAQGVSHTREDVPPLPFAGPRDALRRIFKEQFLTFPHFVLSGGFFRAWREG